jgi:hypothetical protein
MYSPDARLLDAEILGMGAYRLTAECRRRLLD